MQTVASEDSLEAQSQDEAGRTKCFYCGFVPPMQYTGLANHLRYSEACLEHHRNDDQFQGNREKFVIQVALNAGECPAAECPGGSHRKGLPGVCIQWWRQAGFQSMGWWRVNSDVPLTDQVIKRKITDFKYRCRTRSRNQGEPDSRKNQEKTVKPNLCFCKFDGPVAAHLRQSSDCISMMEKKNFLATRPGGQQNIRQAIYEASLALTFCPNPCCDRNGIGGGPIQHISTACMAFIKSEAAAVYGWNEDCTIEEFKGKG